MSLIPRFYCDNCGHAFSHPVQKRGFLQIFSIMEDDFDDRCPKCDNPDFELLETTEKGIVVSMNQSSIPA